MVSASIILLVTSAAKLISSTMTARILDASDPLFGFKNRQIMVTVGLIELLVVGILLFANNARLKLVLITWVGFNFILYRLASWLFVFTKPCPCLGTIADLIHVRQETLNVFLTSAAIYLLLGGTSLLALNYWNRSTNAFVSPVNV
jgi:hypothetical protein